MRFKSAIVVAVEGVFLASAGDMAPAQPSRASASIAVQKSAAPLDIAVKTDGGGVTYFGGVFLEFGDGHRQLLCGPGRGCRQQTVEHNYEKAGTYTIRMVGLGEPEQGTLAETTVTVPIK